MKALKKLSTERGSARGRWSVGGYKVGMKERGIKTSTCIVSGRCLTSLGTRMLLYTHSKGAEALNNKKKWTSQRRKHTTSLENSCQVSRLLCVCVSATLLVKEEGLGESAAALYRYENTPTHWHRGSSNFCCCCCCIIKAGRNRDVLLSELRCLTVISRLIVVMLPSHPTELQQRGT